MKHIFLVNSFSLREKTSSMINKIKSVATSFKLDYIIEVNDIHNSTEDIVSKYKNSENIIYAIGGDGVINRVLNAMIGSKNILGFIPCGTANDFYKTVKESFSSKLQEVDAFKINDNYFINVACFGIDADIGNNKYVVNNKLIPKFLRNRVSILKHFTTFKPRKFKILVDDKLYSDEFSTICVCNARYYGGGYEINPYGKLSDGLFDLIAVKKMDKISLLKFLLNTKKGKHVKYKEVKHIKSDKITIKSEEEINANIDGEILTSKTFKISLYPKKVKVYYDSKLIKAIIDI